MMIVDSLFAGRFVGEGAIAAIAMAVPFFLFENVLHDLFVSGTGAVVTRFKSIGENRKAARAFGAVFANQFFWVTAVHILLVLSGSALMHLFSDDEQLISDALQYYYPCILSFPLTEAGLCLTAGFRTDGRAEFFAFRGLLGNILNLLFNFLSVFVFDGGIEGLAIASSLAGIFSYCWPLSHFFSKKCTIRPDLSVLKAPKEMREYLKEEYKIGTVFAIDDSLFTVAGTVINKRLLACDGAAAITCYGIVTTVTGLYNSFCTLVQNTYYQLSEMFYSDRDNMACKVVYHTSLQLELMTGTVFCALAALGSGLLIRIYDITTPGVKALLPEMLLIFSMATALIGFSNINSSLFLATRQNKQANRMNTVFNLSIIAGVLIGSRLFGLKGLMIGEVIAVVLVLGVEYLLIGRSGILSEKGTTVELRSFSYTLNEFTASESGRKVQKFFSKYGYGTLLAAKAAAVSEECALLMLERNADRKKPVSVDLRLIVDENGYGITLIDNGEIFDPYDKLVKSEDPERMELSRSILKGFSPEGKYSRVLDLNISHLYLNK